MLFINADLSVICACSSVDRAVASDAMCGGSIPLRRTSGEPPRAVSRLSFSGTRIVFRA